MRVVKPIQFNSLSFERDSEGYYYNSAGGLSVAAIDVLREGYNPETLEYTGPMFESGQTNKLLYSNDFTHGVWVPSGGTTITSGFAVSPTGATDASKINGFGEISQPISAGSSHCFSIFVKPETAGSFPSGTSIKIYLSDTLTKFALFRLYSDNAASVSAFGVQYHTQKMQGGWYRIAIFIESETSAITIIPNADFLIYGAMVEGIAGSFTTPSSYILSAATSGIRAADIQNSPPSVVSSNIPATDNPEWSDAASYSADDVVTVLDGYNRNYRAVSDMIGAPTPYPPSSPSNWIDIGAINRWRMFDMSVGADLQSNHPSEIDVTLAANAQINSIALFNISASSVKVTAYYNGGIIYEREIETISPPTQSQWYNYWFDRRRKIKDVAFLDMPPAQPITVRIQAFAEGGAAAIGKAVIGYGEYLGFAEYGTTSIGITDYSTKEPDAFGNYFVQERRFVGKMSVKTVVDPGNELHVRDSLAEVRATASAYIVPTQFEPIMVLGFFKDFSVLFSTPAASYCSTEIEGI